MCWLSIHVILHCLLLSKLKNVNIFIQIRMFTLRPEKQQACHKCSVWPLLIVFFECHWFSYRIFFYVTNYSSLTVILFPAMFFCFVFLLKYMYLLLRSDLITGYRWSQRSSWSPRPTWFARMFVTYSTYILMS